MTPHGVDLVDRVIQSLLTIEHGFVSSALSDAQIERTAALLRVLAHETEA